MQQSCLTEAVKNDLISDVTPETKRETFRNMSKPAPKETTEPKNGGKIKKIKVTISEYDVYHCGLL